MSDQTVDPQDVRPDQTVAEQVNDAYYGIDPNELEGSPDLSGLPESSPETEPAGSVAQQSAPAGNDWFDNDLKERAAVYGMSEEHARNLGSPEALNTAIDFLSQQLLDQNQQLNQPQVDNTQPQPQQQPQQPQEQQPPQQPQQQPPQQPQQYFEKYEPDLGEFADEGVRDAIQGMNDHYHNLIQERDQVLAQVMHQNQMLYNHIQSEQSQQFAERMDSRFDGVAEEYGHLFGRGEMSQLTPNSPEQNYRNKVVQQMDTLNRVFASQGRRVSEERCFKEAVFNVLRELGPAAQPHHSNGQARGTNGRFLAPPSHNNSQEPPLTEAQRIDRSVEEFAAARGLPL